MAMLNNQRVYYNAHTDDIACGLQQRVLLYVVKQVKCEMHWFSSDHPFGVKMLLRFPVELWIFPWITVSF